jgi:hypothetical protein
MGAACLKEASNQGLTLSVVVAMRLKYNVL